MRHDERNVHQHLRLFKAKTMWIPDPIYKKLPLVYTATGATLILAFGHSGPIAVSALMFFAAAVLTVVWRRNPPEKDEPVSQDTLREEWAQRRARRLQSMKVKT
jgi:hypothetical protein